MWSGNPHTPGPAVSSFLINAAGSFSPSLPVPGLSRRIFSPPHTKHTSVVPFGESIL